MSAYEYAVLDSFTRRRFAGNPAGVVLHDGTLTGAQMQLIAGELGLETAFLMPLAGTEADNADYRAAYYTGTRRIPLCGHDTVAAAVLLAHTTRLSVPGTVRFATDVGDLSVEMTEEGTAIMEQARPQHGASASADDVADALGLTREEIVGPPQVVSTGTPFLFAPIRTRAALDALRPDGARLAAFLDVLPGRVNGAYVWTQETTDPAALVHARCFAPGVGLPEDPVTGSASGALGAYLLRHGLARPDADGMLSFMTEQGHAMGRPGHAQVRLEVTGEDVTRVQVGGHAVLVAQGRFWV
ncbi:MAG: PhzF family phenazine biosynthesis protein [Armatimonadetes bacterium]|nr:PhzF family phenazine biosynthesis protein [Armatimonadota bacterium]